MATKEMTIKLMVDTESNRLIFAEASKDFVDFLIFLLSLPIGSVIKLLTSELMVGSIGNIYTSVAKLDETYLLPNVNKNVILNPMVFSSVTNTPLSVMGSSINSSRKFYTCCDPKCKRGITNVLNGTYCPGCYGIMNQEMEFIDKDSEGYAQNAASYMISDDLSITSVSSLSIVSIMNKFNAYKLEERKVKLGTKEALELLKASFLSTTVLTDVFLRTKMEEGQDQCRMSNDPNTNQGQDLSEGQSASQPPRSENLYVSPQAPFIPTQPMQYPVEGLFSQWISSPPNPCATFSGPTPSQNPRPPLTNPPYYQQNPQSHPVFHNQQNAYPYGPYPYPHPHQPAYQPPPPLPVASVRVSVSKNNCWSFKEDLQLCRAWAKVFGGKRKDKMWERVKDTFFELMKEAYGDEYESVRNVGGCHNRMRDLKKQCRRWEDVRTDAFQQPASGSNVVDLEALAMQMWENENNGKPFCHMACWKVLKECPKWHDWMKKPSDKGTGSTSQPCVDAPAHEPLDSNPLPEFAPVHTLSNGDKSRVHITPKTEEDSTGRTDGLTEKGVTSRDIDSPPSRKRAKGTNKTAVIGCIGNS